jgi:hypothetical protein
LQKHSAKMYLKAFKVNIDEKTFSREKGAF